MFKNQFIIFGFFLRKNSKIKGNNNVVIKAVITKIENKSSEIKFAWSATKARAIPIAPREFIPQEIKWSCLLENVVWDFAKNVPINFELIPTNKITAKRKRSDFKESKVKFKPKLIKKKGTKKFANRNSVFFVIWCSKKKCWVVRPTINEIKIPAKRRYSKYSLKPEKNKITKKHTNVKILTINPPARSADATFVFIKLSSINSLALEPSEDTHKQSPIIIDSINEKPNIKNTKNERANVIAKLKIESSNASCSSSMSVLYEDSRPAKNISDNRPTCPKIRIVSCAPWIKKIPKLVEPKISPKRIRDTTLDIFNFLKR